MAKNTPRSCVKEDKRIGERIKIHRRAKHISQDILGKALGITFQQVQKYEKGTNRVGAARLKQISEFLEVSTDDLLGGDPQETRGDVGELMACLGAPQGIRLARMIVKLTVPQRDALGDFVERMLAVS